LLGFSLLGEQQERAPPTVGNVAYNILLTICPLTGMIELLHSWENQPTNYCPAGVVNAILVFFTFLVSLPAMAMPMNRGWLKLQGWLVVVCSFFTLILGLFIWYDTLQTRKNLSIIWGLQSPAVQGLLQQRVCRDSLRELVMNCCGSKLTLHLVPMLRLLKRHDAAIYCRHRLPQPECRRPKGAMRWSIFKFCECIP
jgi:hypothetical protein